MVFSREVVLKQFQILLSKKSQTCYLDFYQMHLKHIPNAKITISLEMYLLSTTTRS